MTFRLHDPRTDIQEYYCSPFEQETYNKVFGADAGQQGGHHEGTTRPSSRLQQSHCAASGSADSRTMAQPVRGRKKVVLKGTVKQWIYSNLIAC
jgi:hypothetical protein